jgi:Glycosyl hydrolases family 18
MKQEQRKRRVRRVVLVLMIAITVFAVDYFVYPYQTHISAPTLNKGENGIWVRHTWADSPHTDAEYDVLASRFAELQVRKAYIHLRSVDATGKLKHPPGPNTLRLTAALKRLAPNVQLIAWIYVNGDPAEHDGVNLTDQRALIGMCKTAADATRNSGFDGVQWDVEPVASGSSNFLAMLRKTRAAIGPGKLLSIATPMWEPAPLRAFSWSESYFTAVSKECDEIAVMCYDTGFYTPRAYSWLVRQQAIKVTAAIGKSGRPCRAVFGVPAYADGLRSHNPGAENLYFALRAIREGLDDPAADKANFAGVSIFAEYTLTPQDIATYKELWLAK